MKILTLLAEADAVNSFSPYAALGANGVLVALCVWLITKHMPARDAAELAAREKSEANFVTELRLIREGFDKQLTEQRKQSGELAKSGHMTVTALSEAFHELAVAISHSSDVEVLTKSGILRRRERKEDSVLE